MARPLTVPDGSCRAAGPAAPTTHPAGSATRGTAPVTARTAPAARRTAPVALGTAPAAAVAVLLRIPPEPGQLAVQLRRLALEAPALARDETARLVAKRLWRSWQRELAPSGISAQAFAEQVATYRRELWLWAVGERRWEQAVGGLAGRVARRAQPSAGDRSAEAVR